jgi:putative PIN family toxin of toxin-antitoxin system
MSRRLRVLVDANVFLSYLLSPDSSPTAIHRVVDSAFELSFTLLFPPKLAEEIRKTISTKSYFSSRIHPGAADQLLAELEQLAVGVPQVNGRLEKVTRDQKDDYLIANAIAGRADYLVSGDKDLLVLGDALAPLKIRTPAAFIEELDRESNR